MPMILRQLFDQTSSTYSYLLADERTRDAVLIDPVFERHARDVALIRELGLQLRYSIDTHCHADHVTGAWLMKRELGSEICLAKVYGAKHVDVPLSHGDVLHFGTETLEVRATPGHTAGCLSLVTGDRQAVFTGDALLVRGTGRTDFQEGDAHRLFASIREQLFSLPDDCVVYPAHDYEGRTCSTIGEERRFNPRIGGEAREEDFVGYLQNLALPHPKQIGIALPANLESGKPQREPTEQARSWGPVVATYAGIPEIAAEWVAQHKDRVQLLDVRHTGEFNGELGHLNDARLVPLEELRARVAELGHDKPVVVICQTGKRSSLGALILEKAGFGQVASLQGGMLRWRDLGLPS
ncbi:MAG TPA: MBL fold metallo-hydrolase [Polyangiaceae bacterium]|nr:MBL fold metallo-hydrolase [Polyangiaceae bacterium]